MRAGRSSRTVGVQHPGDMHRERAFLDYAVDRGLRELRDGLHKAEPGDAARTGRAGGAWHNVCSDKQDAHLRSARLSVSRELRT